MTLTISELVAILRLIQGKPVEEVEEKAAEKKEEPKPTVVRVEEDGTNAAEFIKAVTAAAEPAKAKKTTEEPKKTETPAEAAEKPLKAPKATGADEKPTQTEETPTEPQEAPKPIDQIYSKESVEYYQAMAWDDFRKQVVAEMAKTQLDPKLLAAFMDAHKAKNIRKLDGKGRRELVDFIRAGGKI